MNTNKTGLPLDAIGYRADGAVVLSDADLLKFEQVAKVKAGGDGSNFNCNGTTNDICRNSFTCQGSLNGECSNSNCTPPKKQQY